MSLRLADRTRKAIMSFQLHRVVSVRCILQNPISLKHKKFLPVMKRTGFHSMLLEVQQVVMERQDRLVWLDVMVPLGNEVRQA